MRDAHYCQHDGGLQEQVTDGENWFGIGVEPCSKAVIGSQEVPYIYEDRLEKETFIDALERFYNLSSEQRAEMGRLGAAHVHDNYNYGNYPYTMGSGANKNT